MSKNHVSPSQMPMREIAEYMEKVSGFGKKTDSSSDTQNVAGIKSEVIAKAATNEQGELIVDRETVRNALSLGGVDASNYVTSEGASALLADTHQVSVGTGDEIKNLRDELYQIKAELLKSGMIKNSDCYNGFIDGFKVGDEKYINKIITVTNSELSEAEISFISVEDVSDLSVGEYIVIDTDEPQIAKIQDITSSNRVNLVSSIIGPIASGTEIHKTHGMYSNGCFSFGKNLNSAISRQERYIMLNDDAQPLLLTKKYTPNSGYAAQINIPSLAKGAIRRVGVQAKVTGFPGSLKCYVIDSSDNIESILGMSTIEELKANGLVLGESDLLYPSQATTGFNELYLNFTKPVVLTKANYMFLFVQIDADVNNFWELKGLRGQTVVDLQTNSKLFNFSDGVGLRAEDGDLYLVVVTSEILLDYMQYSKQGLYSCNFDLNSLTKATRVRVELKVNREGRFKVVDNPNTLVPNMARPLTTYNEDNKSYPISLFNTGDVIAIGNQIAQVGNNKTGNTSFNLADDTYAPAGANVYRVGYEVQVKACNKSFDKTDVNNPIKVKDTIVKSLPLVAIIPGKESGKEGVSSDRLIFEAEIKVDELTSYKLNSFNNIEAQVFWKTNATKIELGSNPELAGKIFDITISTDNTYNTINEVSASRHYLTTDEGLNVINEKERKINVNKK